jgi:hypothetical protein
LLHIALDKATKNVVGRGIIRNNSAKLSYDAVILKNWEKDRELGLFAIARDLLEGEEGLLPLSIVRSKIGTDCQKKISI